MAESKADLRRNVLHELKEELRTHGKYAGWHRLLVAIERAGKGALTVGRLADRVGKDYHGTYVQLGRFRDFVDSWARRNGHRLGATAELTIRNDAGPTTVELSVRPLLPEEATIALSESDHSLLCKILGSIHHALENGEGMPADKYEALRKQAARLGEILDTAAWKARLKSQQGRAKRE